VVGKTPERQGRGKCFSPGLDEGVALLVPGDISKWMKGRGRLVRKSGPHDDERFEIWPVGKVYTSDQSL